MPTSFRHGHTVNPAETAQEILKAAQDLPTGMGDSNNLLASNIAPNVQNLDQMQQFDGIQTDSPLPDSDEINEAGLPSDAVSQYQDTRHWHLKRDIPRVAMPGAGDRAVFPYRGSEDALLAECTKDNSQAWNAAFDAFPELQKYLPEQQQGTLLMKALVRNELHHYDVKDGFGDTMAKLGHPKTSETLGYSQITPTGVRDFCNRYPQLKQFISQRHTGPNAEAEALRDPACVPMIVAAKLQSEVDFYKQANDKLSPAQKVPINARTLAYAYNADVYYNPSNPQDPDFHSNIIPKAKELEKLRGYEKAYPTGDDRVLSKSQHLKNVEEQMRLLR